MYLCICNQISDQDVKELKLKHPKLPDLKLLEMLGLGSDCGSCIFDSKDLDLDLAAKCKKLHINS